MSDASQNDRIRLLRERATWYLDGCPHLEDGDHYWRSGDLRRDVHDDLSGALDMVEALAAWQCSQSGARFAESVNPVLLEGVKRCSSCANAESAQAALEKAETHFMDGVLAHWFTQGAESQFGDLGQPTNADGLVASIMSRMRDALIGQRLHVIGSPEHAIAIASYLEGYGFAVPAGPIHAAMQVSLQNATPAEVCICAAIQLHDRRVIKGHRHDDCILTAVKWREAGQKVDEGRAVQGFVTSQNRFVDRTEGAALMRSVHWVSADTGMLFESDTLFSEDLY